MNKIEIIKFKRIRNKKIKNEKTIILKQLKFNVYHNHKASK